MLSFSIFNLLLITIMNLFQLNRLAIAIYFFTNGFLYANLMARLPQFQEEIGITDIILGSLLFMIALGSMLGMPVIGFLATRFGSDKMARLVAICFCFIVPAIPFAPTTWFAGVAFLFMGLSMGAMDVCMNAQAIVVERNWKKPLMSSFHAMFSIGMVLGAGISALVSKAAFPLQQHIIGIAMLCLALIVWASNYLVRENTAAKRVVNKPAKSRQSILKILPLGIISLCSLTGEGSMADWSAIYMHKVVGQDLAFSAIAFGTYAAGMTIGRLVGDYTTLLIGKRRLMILDALITIMGLGISLVFVSVPVTLIGFFLVGLGVSTVVPIVFSTAGNTKGVNPSVGIATVSSIGYTGFFIGPPVIGFLSETYGLRIGLSFPLFLFVVMLLLTWIFIVERK